LRKSGIVKQGQIAITYFDTHIDNVIWFWAVVAAGGIGAIMSPVSNEPKTAAGQLDNMKELFPGSPLITSAKFGSRFSAQGFTVELIENVQKYEVECHDAIFEDVRRSAKPQDLAAILFTSGSTGRSKAVQCTHAQLIASVKAKSAHLNSHGQTFMTWISFDHSANFCEIHLQSMYVASDQVHVPTSQLVVEPHRFFQVLSSYKVGYTFAPNFFLAACTRSFLRAKDSENVSWDLSSLRTIMCGGEANRTESLAASDELLRRFGAPLHTIKAAYGLSETCSACFYNLESPQYDVSRQHVFASAGKHLPGVLEMRIVPLEDAKSDEGVLHLRGDVVTKGYYNNAAATAACTTDDGWFDTGDIARLDADGRIHLLGRMKEVLILNGNNYSSFELEHSIESSNIAGLTPSFTAVFSTWEQTRQSEAVVVLFHPSEEAIGFRKLSETLQAINKVVVKFCSQKALRVIPLPKSLMPKSTIGKLSRSQLKKQYESGAFEEYYCDELTAPLDSAKLDSTATPAVAKVTLQDVTPLERELAIVYSSVVNVPADKLLGEGALLSSGIDSIGFIKLKKALETALHMDTEIPMPILTSSSSISELSNELTLLGTASVEYDPIVPLVKKGSKPSIFLLPPGAGEFLCWFNLMEYLPDRPIYAVRARGLHAADATFESMEEMLSIYYAAIRRTQPNGPYLLFGYCWGGLIAFELAKMFEADGQTVAFCGGVDNPPDIRRALGHVKYRSVLADFLPALTGMSPAEAQQFTEETSSMEDPEFYEAIYARFPPAVIEENGGLTVQRIKAYGRVEDCHRAMAFDYKPTGTVKSVDMFMPDALPFFDVSGFDSWEAVMNQWHSHAGDARMHKVAGNHYTVLKKPDIEVFQEALNKALEARGV
jgi:acyl-CoA synthetase (AMP-forming)/AMP-acid ligase II/thioesterase domain-containing protein